MNQEAPFTQVIFFLAYLGVFNGLVLSAYYLVKRNRQVSDIYFSLLILTLCARIGKSVFLYFNRDADKLILQIGLSFCVFVGPLLYFYVQSVLKKENTFKRSNQLQLAVWAIFILTIGIIYPYRTHPQPWNPNIVKVIYLIWTAYVMLTLVELKGVFSKVFNSKLSKDESWVLIVTLSVLLILLLFQSALYFGFSYIAGALAFTFLFYILGFRVLYAAKRKKSKITIAKDQAKSIQKTLDDHMESNKPFKNPKLKLEDLANAIDQPAYVISQVLNNGDTNGFTDYVNQHRITEAKELILASDHLSLDGVGKEAGFHSKSTFYPAFKKKTGMTPAQYRKNSRK